MKHDYSTRTQLEKTHLSSAKKGVSIEGRTVDGELRAFSHNRNLGYGAKTIPNTFLSLPTFPEMLVHRLERLDHRIFKVDYVLPKNRKFEGGPQTRDNHASTLSPSTHYSHSGRRHQ